jgi:hypothetical protein
MRERTSQSIYDEPATFGTVPRFGSVTRNCPAGPRRGRDGKDPKILWIIVEITMYGRTVLDPAFPRWDQVLKKRGITNY